MADRVLCSCVTCPKCGAWVDVEREVADLTAAIFSQAPDPEAVRRERIAVHPIGRLGHPKDLAGLAVF